MRHNKRRIYFNNIYKINFDLCKETQKEHTDTLDRRKHGGGGGGAYIRDNIFVIKWIGLYPGGYNVTRILLFKVNSVLKSLLSAFILVMHCMLL